MRHFLRIAADEGLPRKTMSAAAMEALKEHGWPGNVRELQNVVMRLAALCPDDVIDREAVEVEMESQRGGAEAAIADGSMDLAGMVESHLSRYFASHGDVLPPPGLYKRILREIEFPLIALSLAATRGNQIKAADLLGLNRNTLRKKIRELDIPVERRKK